MDFNINSMVYYMAYYTNKVYEFQNANCELYNVQTILSNNTNMSMIRM